LADESPHQDADDGSKTKSNGNALQGREHPPAKAYVLRAKIKEWIDDQVIGIRPNL
jgi:hypothetical protein